MSSGDCPLCSSIQSAVEAERVTVDRLFDSADAVAFRQLPPLEGEGFTEEEWMEFACRRDEYERARAKRLRADNRFFEECPRCHFDLLVARRELEERRAELPWYGRDARRETVRFEPKVRATGS